MTENEYLHKRINLLETALDAFVREIGSGFPYMQSGLDNVYAAWDTAANNLDAEYEDTKDE